MLKPRSRRRRRRRRRRGRGGRKVVVVSSGWQGKAAKTFGKRNHKKARLLATSGCRSGQQPQRGRSVVGGSPHSMRVSISDVVRCDVARPCTIGWGEMRWRWNGVWVAIVLVGVWPPPPLRPPASCSRTIVMNADPRNHRSGVQFTSPCELQFEPIIQSAKQQRQQKVQFDYVRLNENFFSSSMKWRGRGGGLQLRWRPMKEKTNKKKNQLKREE